MLFRSEMSEITCGPIIMGLNRNQSNAVTVPADKLAELQRKAKLVDELKEINVALLTQIDAQARVISRLEKHNEEITDGIRVGVVSRGYKFHPSSLVITSVDPKSANATLILDYPFFKLDEK